MGNYRLAGGQLITDQGIVPCDLLISGSKIQEIISREEITDDSYTVVDCKGLYISPGFVDIHQHGGGGSDYMDDDPDAYYHATEAHLRHGTTSVMPTLLSAAIISVTKNTATRLLPNCVLSIHTGVTTAVTQPSSLV